MGAEPLKRELEKLGIRSARDYAKKFDRPGIGTVERYFDDLQSPITTAGTWRSAPLRMAQQVGLEVEVLFPEAAEERQKILDEISTTDDTLGIPLSVFHSVRCPKTSAEETRPIFVMVDLTCVSCPYKVELNLQRVICSHPKAKDM